MRAYRNPGVAKDFAAIAGPKVQRSKFRRPARRKCGIDAGYLYPILVDEILPGDTFNVNLTSICRMATPIHPIMDNLYLDWHFFFVPNRLVWSNWTRFMGERVDPDDSIDYVVPVVSAPNSTGFVAETLYDYLGIRCGIDGFDVNNLIPRGYNLIWNEWFRHTWLQDSVTVDTDDGPDDPDDYVLLRRGKRSDYFTACLPAPARGDDVLLPLGTEAPVLGIGKGPTSAFPSSSVSVVESDATGSTYTYAALIDPDFNDNKFYVEGSAATDAYPMIRADLSAATAATINDMREAFQLQRILERDARGGTRYTEILQNTYGITPEDSRLQRPEYLGGGSRPLTIEAIPQTSESGTTKQGNLAGVGYSQQSGIGFSKSFTEHGHVFCLASVRADMTYSQGVPRMWSRQTRYDFYDPSLAHLGEMAVLNKEIFVQGTSADDEVFGYMPHWDDMRYCPSMVMGVMRSDHASSLDPWHLGLDFSALPVLNTGFIEEDPPVDRVVAVPSEPQFILDAYFDMTCARPMPMFSTPGLIDHF